MTFQFPWWCPERNEALAKRLSGRFDEMLRAEVVGRANLLLRLGHGRDAVVKRLQDRMKWDFELSKLPPLYKEIPALVDKVFRREHA
jgi:hypothetical protein